MVISLTIPLSFAQDPTGYETWDIKHCPITDPTGDVIEFETPGDWAVSDFADSNGFVTAPEIDILNVTLGDVLNITFGSAFPSTNLEYNFYITIWPGVNNWTFWYVLSYSYSLSDGRWLFLERYNLSYLPDTWAELTDEWTNYTVSVDSISHNLSHIFTGNMVSINISKPLQLKGINDPNTLYYEVEAQQRWNSSTHAWLRYDTTFGFEYASDGTPGIPGFGMIWVLAGLLSLSILLIRRKHPLKTTI